MLEIRGLWKTYSLSRGKLPTLQDISLEVNQGEFVSIIGPSGCGKSTLFNLISGLEKSDAGQILLNGHDISGERGHVAYMLQKDLLLPWRSVLENCMLGMEIQKVPRSQAHQRAQELLGEMGLSEFAQSYPGKLSGGMRQRIAFLRTMLLGKEVLLLDEPFGALDAYTKSEMHTWLTEVRDKYHPTVLFITHDVDEALFLSDRVYVLSHRPARLKMVLEVNLPHPRTRDDLLSPDFVAMKRDLLTALFS